MKITRNTGSYNSRRYGRPWIAKIDLQGNNLVFNFGSWVGDPGDEGVLVLDGISAGDFYARGQKDFRKPQNSAPDYYQVDDEGRETGATKAEIYHALSSK